MLRLLSDGDFNGRIVRGRRPSLDLIRVQDLGLTQTPDPDVLEWAAKVGRQLLSHDTSTMSAAVMDRMPGGFLVHDWLPIGQAIDDILFYDDAAEPEDLKDQIILSAHVTPHEQRRPSAAHRQQARSETSRVVLAEPLPPC